MAEGATVSGYTKEELRRASRFHARWAQSAGFDGELRESRMNERFRRALATEFGRMRRHLLLALKKEVARLNAMSGHESSGDADV